MKIYFILSLLIVEYHQLLSQGRPTNQHIHQVKSQLYSGQITINSYPSPLYVALGTTFTLSCYYNPHTFHSWVHPTRGNISQSTGHLRLQVASSAHIATLIVDSATFDDQGEYACRVRTENNSLMLSENLYACLLYTSPSPRDATLSRMPSSA